MLWISEYYKTENINFDGQNTSSVELSSIKAAIEKDEKEVPLSDGRTISTALHKNREIKKVKLKVDFKKNISIFKHNKEQESSSKLSKR